jgi:hypothetical protein
MNTTLILHAGAKHVERAQLEAVATPRATATWQPIPHWELLTNVEQTLERSGLHVTKEQHGVGRGGARYFGLLEVANGNSDFGLVVGLRNSHDQSFPAGLVVGARVFVCDNLSFSGEVRLARKHTVHILRDLPQLTERAVCQLADLRHSQETRFGAYRGAVVSDAAAHDLIVRAMDDRILPVTRIPDVLDQWRTPLHEFGGKTLWRLFNSFTEVLKATALDVLPRRTQALHGIFDLHCGLIGGMARVEGAGVA